VDLAANEPSQIDVLALHESLERLAAFDPRQERIVELRYFGGLTIEETAEVVGVSDATVAREWRIAKAWLRANLSTSGLRRFWRLRCSSAAVNAGASMLLGPVLVRWPSTVPPS
jgi:hypothetical protein